MAEKKQQVRLVFKVAAFGGFIMLGYLGIRNYRISVEMLKINKCVEELAELSRNIQDRYRNQLNYGELDFKTVNDMRLFPKAMNKPEFREPINSYNGGVDIFYSPLHEGEKNNGFEISFQGLSKMACIELIKNQLNYAEHNNVVAVAGYGVPTPSGVLEEIYIDTKQVNIKNNNVIKAETVRYIDDTRLSSICNCTDLTCSVVWKFR